MTVAAIYFKNGRCKKKSHIFVIKVGVNPSLKKGNVASYASHNEEDLHKNVQKYTFLESEKTGESNGGHRFL